MKSGPVLLPLSVDAIIRTVYSVSLVREESVYSVLEGSTVTTKEKKFILVFYKQITPPQKQQHEDIKTSDVKGSFTRTCSRWKIQQSKTTNLDKKCWDSLISVWVSEFTLSIFNFL